MYTIENHLLHPHEGAPLKRDFAPAGGTFSSLPPVQARVEEMVFMAVINFKALCRLKQQIICEKFYSYFFIFRKATL